MSLVFGNNQLATPSSAEMRRIDSHCDRFEGQLLAGEAPDVQDFLKAFDETLQPCLLRQLLLLQWHYDRARNESINLSDCLARFPAHAPLIRAVAAEHASDLVDHASEFGERAGEQSTVEQVSRS